MGINNLVKQPKNLQNFILDLIFPIECLACGREGLWLCKKCFSALNFKAGQYCLECKKPNNYGEFCDKCAEHYDLHGILIAGVYEDMIIAKMIKSLKYHFARDISNILSAYLALFLKRLIDRSRLSKISIERGISSVELNKIKKIPEILLNFSEILVIPVPLSLKRERWRGFNQAEVLARGLAYRFKLSIDSKNLIRIKHKKPQAKLNEAMRKINLKNCYAWNGRSLGGRNVLLIDDVVTTGSTLNECAGILRGSGAGKIWGLVVAKG